MSFVVFVAIGIVVFLGPLYLFWLSRVRPIAFSPANEPENWPQVDIILPLHNEKNWICRKLANLKALNYPAASLTIWIVDGASDDGTMELAEKEIQDDCRFRILRLNISNKTQQLNEVLNRASGKWIMVTDADAQLMPHTLKQMIATAEGDDFLGVIGTTVRPRLGHALERLHWNFFTRLWKYESQRGFASLVTAPCYLFARTLLDNFPQNTIGDDVYITFLAAEKGLKVRIVECPTIELRSPSTLSSMFRHKLRKADAYLREVLRFLPKVLTMSSPARPIFLWRAAQLTLLPFALVFGAFFSLVWIFQDMEMADLRLVVPLAILFFTALILIWKKSPTVVASIFYLFFLSVVLIVGIVLHPFSRQTADFPKVSESLPESQIV